MKDRVEAEANCVEERIHAYRKAIELHIQTLGIHHVLMQRLRDELHYDLQLLCFLQDLQSVLTETHLRMSRLSERLQEQLQILSATIGSQTCIPNELVFPEFQKVGLLQKRASAEFRKFRSQSRVVEQIFILSNKPNFKRTPIGIAELKTSCGLSKIKVLADYCDFLPAHVYSSTSLQAEIPEPSVMSNRTMEDIVIIDGKEASYMRSTRLYLNGFCLMSIILNGGLLQLGDPKAGLVRIGDKNYTFSTNSALNQFVNSPASYLDALEKMVIAMPQLINTLGLQREPKFAQLAISKVLELVNKRPLRQEFGTQTTTHIQQEHQFDEDTLFLRSKELESKQTHSTQTCGSHFSRDSSSQVWLPRDKSTQSLFGKGTTMPLRLKYFENLRGPPDFKFNPVDILLDV
ncbi:hypothetical protein KP509_01G119800 [Ceratopteris richardii]|nr:hypothetical protein KP509_01G119800 [Ceratopteris richardii]